MSVGERRLLAGVVTHYRANERARGRWSIAYDFSGAMNPISTRGIFPADGGYLPIGCPTESPSHPLELSHRPLLPMLGAKVFFPGVERGKRDDLVLKYRSFVPPRHARNVARFHCRWNAMVTSLVRPYVYVPLDRSRPTAGKVNG